VIVKQLKVGIIIDDDQKSYLSDLLIRESEKKGSFKISTFIIQKTPKSSNNFLQKAAFFLRTRSIKRLVNDFSFKLIEVLEEFALNQFTNKLHKSTSSVNTKNIKKIFVEPKISKSGFVHHFSEKDLLKIRKQGLDVLIRAGSGILKGDILNICRFGILSFHHGDNNFFRGGPPGFWEVFLERDSTGFIIQKLNEDLDGGKVLIKGSIGTSFMYFLNREKIFTKSYHFLVSLLENISNNNSLPSEIKTDLTKSKIYTTPNLLIQIQYLFKTFFRIFKKVIYGLIGITSRWTVGYIFEDDWRSPPPKKINLIKNPRKRFLADPIPFEYKGVNFCFVEDYSYTQKKGRIAAYEINNNSYKSHGVVLDETFHLSFPFIFSNEDGIFMCPETYQSKEIKLYKCLDFPKKWIFYKTLMKEVSAMDNMIFKKNGKWWLFSNIDSSPLEHEGSELHIFFSDSFDSCEWTPLDRNPIIFDSLRGRNAGLIIENDKIFRVFQKQGFDRYGKSFGIAEITNLSEQNYDEKVLDSPNIDFLNKKDAAHTFFHNGKITVFDFAKNDFFNS